MGKTGLFLYDVQFLQNLTKIKLYCMTDLVTKDAVKVRSIVFIYTTVHTFSIVTLIGSIIELMYICTTLLTVIGLSVMFDRDREL